MGEELILYGEAGSGSLAVEAALTLIGAPFRTVEIKARARMGEDFNPLGQSPALRLATGELMTESAPILIWLAEAFPAARLGPAAGSADRPRFLRWMGFVASAIYALYWVRDEPARVTKDAGAQAEVKARLNARIAECWGVMEAGLMPGRYLLGEDLTVLDLYVAVVSRWTPRRALHETIAPRLGEVVRRVEADARLVDLWARRFPLKAAS